MYTYRRYLSVFIVAYACLSCGASTNILGLTTPDEHRESFEFLLYAARAAYDRGDLDKALTYAQEAVDLDPDSEPAAVLFGFVNLSLAGGDPLQLAKALMGQQKEKEAAKEETDEGDESSSSGSGGGASDTLSTMKKVIGLSADDLALMGQLDTTDPDLPVMIPRCAEDARGDVDKLGYVDAAINAVCPFIDEDARMPTDRRQICIPFSGKRHQQPRAHFLWAFTHLTEALAFNSILTYSTADPTGKRSNLELRVDKIKSMDTSAGFAPLLAAMTTLQETLKVVLPVSGECSETAPTTQLKATLNDMLAVDAAFGKIPGVPKKITASIKKAMERIKKAQTQGSDAGSSSKAQAFKGDFTKKIAKGLSEKLDTIAEDPDHPVSAEEKAQLCDAFDAIAAGSEQTATLCGGEAAPTL